jgi:ectoine hydroxylase-related dioxygenase (phytanoyl-CoA dioxygenase family)
MIGPSRTAPLRYIRGLYPVLPCNLGSITQKLKGPHTDGHRFLVGTLTYLSDVAQDGGGFHVWPGSHLILRGCFKNYVGPGTTARYHRELYSFAIRTQAIEIVAPAGSTIFWHHRLAHSAGINRKNEIRHAILADFLSTDFDDLAKKPVGSDEWEHWNFNLAR